MRTVHFDIYDYQRTYMKRRTVGGTGLQ